MLTQTKVCQHVLALETIILWVTSLKLLDSLEIHVKGSGVRKSAQRLSLSFFGRLLRSRKDSMPRSYRRIKASMLLTIPSLVTIVHFYLAVKEVDDNVSKFGEMSLTFGFQWV